MKSPYRICLFTVVCAALGCAKGTGKTNSAPTPNVLCIHVYNRATVTSKTIDRAKSRVTGMLAAAGVPISWEESADDSPEAYLLDFNHAGQDWLRRSDRSCVVVKIVPDLVPGAYGEALGFALPFARSGIDVEAVYRRIELEAERVGIDTEVVLAYVIAHEIGHVLLQSLQHAPAGIMQGHCGASNFRLACRGMLGFLPDEAKEMRKGLWRFLPQAEPLPSFTEKR